MIHIFRAVAQELHTLMEMLGMIVTLDEVNAMIEEIDENNDGEIQFEEFVAVMSRKMKATCTSEEIRTAFRVFEGSGPSGQIKFDVLERLLCGMYCLAVDRVVCSGSQETIVEKRLAFTLFFSDLDVHTRFRCHCCVDNIKKTHDLTHSCLVLFYSLPSPSSFNACVSVLTLCTNLSYATEHGSRKLTPEEAQALLKDLSHAIDSNGYFKYDEYISEMTSD